MLSAPGFADFVSSLALRKSNSVILYRNFKRESSDSTVVTIFLTRAGHQWTMRQLRRLAGTQIPVTSHNRPALHGPCSRSRRYANLLRVNRQNPRPRIMGIVVEIIAT